MPWFGGANKTVIRNVQTVIQCLKAAWYNPIHKFLRRFIVGFGGFVNLFAVFVRTRREPRLISEQPVNPHDHIRNYFFVDMPNVRIGIGVINCGGEVENFLVHKILPISRNPKFYFKLVT